MKFGIVRPILTYCFSISFISSWFTPSWVFNKILNGNVR